MFNSRWWISRRERFVACAETLANDNPLDGIDFTPPIFPLRSSRCAAFSRVIH
jgi:hypothetical protein